MRKFIGSVIKEKDYLLHADMYNTNNFPIKGIEINCGLGESNLLNVASGIARSSKGTIWIYGVVGFIIHRYEQLKFSVRNFGSLNNKIIIFNAGKIGYEELGDGHTLDDDLELMKILGVKAYIPEDKEDLINVLKELDTYKNGLYYIQLGKDF